MKRHTRSPRPGTELATSKSLRRESDPETPQGPGERLVNRELSWLDFNKRVLELACDSDVPLLERVKFCAIVASNLDEFFMVRVAGLLGQEASGLAMQSPDGRTPAETLAEIRERVLALTDRQAKLWSSELRPSLQEEGIVIGSADDLTNKELADLRARFEREIFPVLTPLAVGPGQPFPYISGLSLSLGLLVSDPTTGEERFARVKVPETLPRFVAVGKRAVLIPLESVIAHFLDPLFPGMEIVERGYFRLTRDADFEVSDEADDLLEAVELELRRRRFGDVVRVEVSSSLSGRMLDRLREGLEVTDDQMYPIKGLLDQADLMQVATLERPELRDEPWLPITQPRLAGLSDRGFFDVIGNSDVIVHHPYDSFISSVEAFIRAAAHDPDVIGIKTTVYRTSDDSPIVPALVEAAERGKQTVCLVELKARFDELQNIEWSRALEEAGVHVVYGFPNLKIHAKTTLVVRREGDQLRRYCHIGTGNYHAATARSYEDVGIFTADEEVVDDVANLFNYLTGFGRPQTFKRILVAPFTLRSRLIDEIRSVTSAVEAGKPGRIRIKVNALVDQPIIEELYTASQSGVEIDVVARGICSLRPGVPGMSETIRVRSILGRFLEHSRVYNFEAGDEHRVFMGSADLMPRNLDHRIEVVTPVLDAHARRELRSVFDTLLGDNAQSWELKANGSWNRLRPEKGQRARRTHPALMRRARTRGRRRTAPVID